MEESTKWTPFLVGHELDPTSVVTLLTAAVLVLWTILGSTCETHEIPWGGLGRPPRHLLQTFHGPQLHESSSWDCSTAHPDMQQEASPRRRRAALEPPPWTTSSPSLSVMCEHTCCKLASSNSTMPLSSNHKSEGPSPAPFWTLF